jgi:coenzyme PQQ precursor peptide PqqA
LSRAMALPGTGEVPMVSSAAPSAGSAGTVAGAVGARTGTTGARLAGGRFFCAVRAGRCLGTGTSILRKGVDDFSAAGDGVLAGGAGAVPCAHTLYGNTNARTPTHKRRMNFPAEFMAESKKSPRSASRSQDPALQRKSPARRQQGALLPNRRTREILAGSDICATRWAGDLPPRRPFLRARSAVPNISRQRRRCAMAWTTPTLVEICIGLEINGYLPAEF